MYFFNRQLYFYRTIRASKRITDEESKNKQIRVCEY